MLLRREKYVRSINAYFADVSGVFPKQETVELLNLDLKAVRNSKEKFPIQCSTHKGIKVYGIVFRSIIKKIENQLHLA